MKKLILAVCLSLVLISQAQAQSLVAKVNRNPVPLGETFVLTLEYDGTPAANQKPDFAPLNDKFVVYSILNSYSSSYSNGVTKRNYQWNVSLSPKEAGNITIPSLKMGGLETKPITLRVSDSLSSGSVSAASAGGPKFSISRVIDNPHPLVQEQINYKLTISTTESLQGNEPSFLLSDENEWIIRSLGAPKIRSEIIDGVEVKKIDFEYALFPQKSGDLVIPEVRFDGYYLNQNMQRRVGSLSSMLDGSFWGDRGFGFDAVMPRTPVVLTAKPIAIKVGKIPTANNGNWWLPAKSVEMVSDWAEGIPDFKSGEAVNRTIYVKAVGVIDTQMPKLTFPNANNLKQYPEKPSYSGDVVGENVVSVMKVNNVYIPQRSGILTIPEIKLSWYNVNTKKMEQAVLPAVKVNVLKGSMPDAAEAEILASDVNVPKADTVMPTPKSFREPYLIYGAVFIAFLFGLFFSYILFRPKEVKTIIIDESEKKPQPVCVSKAFKGDDLKAMRDSVLAWARNFYGEEKVANLFDVARLTNDPEFKKQLDLLNTALYSNSNCQFNPGEFLLVFDKVSKKHKKSKKPEKLLPDLYQ